MTTPLESLRSDAFLHELFAVSSAEALATRLRRHPAVHATRAAVESGELGVQELDGFVGGLMESFERGQRFPEECTLAALAVVLEILGIAFADQFLEKLASLRIREIPIAPRVAMNALSRRRQHIAGLTDTLKVVSIPQPSQASVPTEFEPTAIEAGLSEFQLRVAS